MMEVMVTASMTITPATDTVGTPPLLPPPPPLTWGSKDRHRGWEGEREGGREGGREGLKDED